MINIDRIKLNGKIINIIISTSLIGLLLFDLFTQGNIFKDNFFYSGKALFSDLIVIIPNLEELAKWDLFDSEKKSSTELFNRYMNYPVIWVYIFHFFSWFGNPANILGILQLFLYILFSKIILLQTNKYFYIYLFILFSPPILLMLERGNMDSTIFFLLLLSFISNNYISGFLIGLAASLKVYPIFILPFYFFFQKFNKSFFIGFILTLPLIFWTFLQLNTLIGQTPISFSTSFGVYSFALLSIKALKEIFFIDIETNYIFYFYLISIFMFFTFSIIFNYFFKKDINKILSAMGDNKQNLMIFILSSTITIIIFFVFSNWAYRIIFLLPATIIYLNNSKNLFSYPKNIFFLLMITAPFFFPWIITTTDKSLVLFNFHAWAFYSLSVYFSLIIYFVISVNFYLKSFTSLKKS